MKKIFSWITLGCAGAVLTLSGTASAVWQPSYWRCAADQFPYSGPSVPLVSRLALGRQHWAKDALAATNNQKYWVSAYDADVITALNTYGIDLYPVYMDLASPTFAAWVGPGPNGTGALWSNTYLGIKAKDRNLKPASVEIAGICEPGCYTGDQEIRFESGNTPILEALNADKKDVVTLSPDSSFGAFSFFTNEVARYTQDIEAAEQEILVFHMKSGGELKVTPKHPLLGPDGVMRTADELQDGDDLVQEDGSLDPIASIERTTMTTKVYNLRPVTTDLISNILVAQGYMTGSARYQSEFTEYLNRLLWRRKVPMELIPTVKKSAKDLRPDVAQQAAEKSLSEPRTQKMASPRLTPR